jgi:hypothetical protein
MVQEQPPTPERELLKFIEGKHSSPDIKVKSSARKGRSFFSLGGLRGRFSYFRARAGKLSFGEFGKDLRSINIMLIVATVLIAAGIIFDLSQAITGMPDKLEAAFAIDSSRPSYEPKEVVPLDNLSSYLEYARQRDIFQMVSKVQPEVSVAAQAQVTVKPIVVKTENLKLVGISWSRDPDVLIEDTKANKTFFLKRGDLINDVTVKAVFRDKVILSYEGDEVELK